MLKITVVLSSKLNSDKRTLPGTRGTKLNLTALGKLVLRCSESTPPADSVPRDQQKKCVFAKRWQKLEAQASSPWISCSTVWTEEFTNPIALPSFFTRSTSSSQKRPLGFQRLTEPLCNELGTPKLKRPLNAISSHTRRGCKRFKNGLLVDPKHLNLPLVPVDII